MNNSNDLVLGLDQPLMFDFLNNSFDLTLAGVEGAAVL